MPPKPLSLKGRALRLLARREHSRGELEHKLEPFEDTPEQLARTLDELQAKGFINDQRVADSVLHQRAAKLGSLRIRLELQNKGLKPELVRSALESLHGTELERARAVWRKKFDSQPTDAAQRARQSRFLAARGFSADVVRRVTGADPDEA